MDNQNSSDIQLNVSEEYDDSFEEPLNSSNTVSEITESIEKHSTCQFKSDKFWVDCQYHDLQCTSIKKPDEIENEMEDPPINYDEEILDRIQGSMFGMALGDALGAHVEFRPREYLSDNPVEDLQGGGTWGLQKGQFTDDTSMALCLANSLIARQEFNCYDQLVRYRWWQIHGYMSSTGQCFDIGAATSQSLQEFAHRQKIFSEENNIPIKDLDFLSDLDLIHKFNVYCSEEGVAGNGALMRLAPVPLFFYKDPVRAVEFSGISGQITHGDQKAYDACRYYGALIVAALNGETKEQLFDKDFYLNHQYWFNGKDLHIDIMNIIQGSYQKQGGYDDGIRGKGYIVDALEAALWAFWSDQDSFKKGVLAAVNLGDDTDTTAAIYGQLAGAYYGYHHLPSEWVQQIYASKFIETLSKWIAHEGQKQKIEKIPEQVTVADTKLPDDEKITTPTTLAFAKPQDDQKITPPTTPDHVKSNDDQIATPPISPTVAKSQDDQKVTPPTTPSDTKSEDDLTTTSLTTSDDAEPQDDQKITPPTTPNYVKPQDDQIATPPTTLAFVKPQDDQETTPPTTPTVAKPQDDQIATSPTTLAFSKPQDDQETTPPTTPNYVKPQDDQIATSPTTLAFSKPQDDQETTPPTTPNYVKPQDDQIATSPTTLAFSKPQNDQETTPPTTPNYVKPQDDQIATSPTTLAFSKPQDDQETTPPTTPNYVKPQDDQIATSPTALAFAKPQDDQETTPPTTPNYVKPQDDQEVTLPTTPDHVKLQDDQKVTPPTAPSDTKLQDDLTTTSLSTPDDEEPQDDQETIPPTILIDTKSQDNQEATLTTTLADAITQDDQEATPPTTPSDTKSQNDQKITPPTTPDYVKPQDDQEVTPPTTPADSKLQDGQNIIPKTLVNEKQQDDQNIILTTSVYTEPQEDLKMTSTIPSNAQIKDDQNTISSAFDNVKTQNNLTTVPTSPQTLHSGASEFSSRKSDRIPTDEPKYEYESYRSDPTYYSSPIREQSSSILKTIETRSIWENPSENRPFSSESASYLRSSNKPMKLNKNLLACSVNDIYHWVQSFGEDYSSYANSFRKDFIDGFRLYNFINDYVLIEYGVQNKDHRQNILDAIQEIRREFLQARRRY